MGKKPNQGAAREAARRAAQAPKPPTRPRDVHPDIWEVMQRDGVDRAEAVRRLQAASSDVDVSRDLRSVARELRQLEQRRRELVARRDELVAVGRVAGISWTDLARAAGTTRPALIQRDTTRREKQ